jgi:hypothetical protein
MEFVSKAALDTVTGQFFMRQDLSSAVSLTTTRPRPVSQNAPRVAAKNTTHQWVEQGRNGVAGQGGAPVASYADGNLPNTAAKAPTRPQNTTALLGLTAQVTDAMAAAWTQGGSFTLETGQEVKLLTDAMDEQTELATLDTLDFLEWMHISGDSSNPQGFPGGQFDGLIKWIGASGVVYNTSGTSASPAPMAENFIKKAARQSAELYPSIFPNTMLVPPELIVDVNGYVANGAGRPMTIVVDGTKPEAVQNLVGGQSLGWYNTGYSMVKIELEPDLSPAFNPYIDQPAIVLYNKGAVKNASLIKFGATPLAKTDTSVKTMVNNVVTQEHRVPSHAILIPHLASAVS